MAVASDSPEKLFLRSKWSAVAVVSITGYLTGFASLPFLVYFSNFVGDILSPFLIIPFVVALSCGVDYMLVYANKIYCINKHNLQGQNRISSNEESSQSCSLSNIIHKVIFWRNLHMGNFWRAFGLGLGSAVGLYLALISHNVCVNSKIIWTFGLYIFLVAFFHWSEFFTAAICNKDRVSTSLYMLNHSPEYLAAVVISVTEHWLGSLLRIYYFPNLAIPTWINLLGLAICIGGETLRKVAMVTASTNFNHFVQLQRAADHQLVTHGVYAHFRHPAYVGWFYWSLGTQLLLGNPICSLAYPVAAQRFFEDRVFTEEMALCQFFGQHYRDYQRVVPTGLPFIHGYPANA